VPFVQNQSRLYRHAVDQQERQDGHDTDADTPECSSHKTGLRGRDGRS